MLTFKKIHLAITTLLLTVVGQVHGDCHSSTIGECADSCSCAPTCCSKGFISADLLYLRAQQGGFAGGCIPEEIDNFVTSEGNIISRIRGNSKDPHFRWDTGFRLGTGYECGNWDIAAYWTHFHTHTRDHHQRERQSDDYLSDYYPSEPNQFRWKLDYEVVDVILGRGVCIDSFTFRPFIGVRLARIDQKVKSQSLNTTNIFFDTSSFSSSSNSVFSNDSSENLINPNISDFFLAEEKNRERFKGVGPLIGVEADWNLGCGVSLYAGAAVSTLYGHFKVRFNGFSTFLNGTNTCDRNEHLCSCQFATDFMLGIRWQHCYCNNMQVLIQLGLEQHRYFDHNRLGGYGDLCLDGGSLSAAVSF